MDDKEKDQTDQEDIWVKREEWLRRFIHRKLPKTSTKPNQEIYRKVREHYFSPPSMKECTRVPLNYQSEIGHNISFSFLQEIETTILANIFDSQFALTEQELSQRIAWLKEIVKDDTLTEEDYVKGIAQDYEYNMGICLNYATQNFEDNQINWLLTVWWFASFALATKTIQDLRGRIRWYKPARIAAMREFLLQQGQERVDQMLGKTPTGPTPDYWGFADRLIKAGNLMWERKEKLTQPKLAEEMGISETALKQQLKRYGIKWQELLDGYYKTEKGK